MGESNLFSSYCLHLNRTLKNSSLVFIATVLELIPLMKKNNKLNSTQKPRIAVVCSYCPTNNWRVRKIVNSLGKKFTVLMLGWDRDGGAISDLNKKKNDLNLFGLHAPYGKKYLIFYYPFFWSWIFMKLIALKPDVVHSCDLDTIIPCLLFKKLFRRKLIFDVFDRFAMLHILDSNSLWYKIVNWLEENAAAQSDVLITVGEKLLSTFRSKPALCELILNCADEIPITKNRPNDQTLTLVYTGPIEKYHALEMVADILKRIENVDLLIAGRIVDNALLQRLLHNSKVNYVGFLLPSDSIQIEAASDVMLAIYDPRRLQNQYAMPNKLFEALMCGLPIITNIAKEIVQQEQCGLIVDHDDIQDIMKAIIKLRDDQELRNNLSMNAKMAFYSKYNWKLMEFKLYGVYERLGYN